MTNVTRKRSGRFAWLVLFAFGSILLCCDSPTVISSQPPNPADVEADEVVQVIRTYYPSWQRVLRAATDLDICMDKTVGWHALAECLNASEQIVFGEIASNKGAYDAKSACGSSLRKSYVDFFNAEAGAVGKFDAWMKRN